MEKELSFAILTIIIVVIIGVAGNEIFKIRNPRSNNNNTNDMIAVMLTQEFRVEWRFGSEMPNISSVFDPQKDTIILVHGFATSAGGEFPTNVADAYLRTYRDRDAVNIICVDWGQFSGQRYADYRRVSQRLPGVAGCVACFLYCLRETGLDLAKVHLIGHSLGAHICGRVGLTVQADGHNIGMITGLDPAARGFGGENGYRQLQRSDATFVQVLHTSCFLGAQEHLGDMDYFVNGGGQQPNCGGWDLLGICDHAEAHRLFAQAILGRDTTYRFRP